MTADQPPADNPELVPPEPEETGPGPTENDDGQATDSVDLAEPGQEREAADAAIRASLVSLGFVSFDRGSGDSVSTDAMVSPDRRIHFRRDVYVGIRDDEQQTEFLGRVVEGPFHSPHEISTDSAISRTTLLYPERTRFRPTYYVEGTIEILGEIRAGAAYSDTSTALFGDLHLSVRPIAANAWP